MGDATTAEHAALPAARAASRAPGWRRRLARLGAAALGAAFVVALAAAAVVYALSERRLARRHDTGIDPLVLPLGGGAVARGEHLATAVANCTLCHGADLGGAVYADMGAMGVIAGPNLTRGRGGVGAARTDADLVRAIRRGVHPDGTSLIAMPSEVFVHMSAPDLASLVAYVRQLTPVDRVVPRTHFGPLGRALLAAGKLRLLVAEKTPALPFPAPVPVGPTPEYGRYLANIAGCHGCHGFGLSGGRVAGPPGLPPASNLTPAGIGRWSEGDFVRAMREGRRPGGAAIDPFMPWQTFRRMDDVELRALWAYLRTVPARPFGNK